MYSGMSLVIFLVAWLSLLSLLNCRASVLVLCEGGAEQARAAALLLPEGHQHRHRARPRLAALRSQRALPGKIRPHAAGRQDSPQVLCLRPLQWRVLTNGALSAPPGNQPTARAVGVPHINCCACQVTKQQFLKFLLAIKIVACACINVWPLP